MTLKVIRESYQNLVVKKSFLYRHDLTQRWRERDTNLWWFIRGVVWEGGAFQGRTKVIKRHPQHSNSTEEHGHIHHPSHQNVGTTGIPCLRAVAGSFFHAGTGGCLHGCLLNWGWQRWYLWLHVNTFTCIFLFFPLCYERVITFPK